MYYRYELFSNMKITRSNDRWIHIWRCQTALIGIFAFSLVHSLSLSQWLPPTLFSNANGNPWTEISLRTLSESRCVRKHTFTHWREMSSSRQNYRARDSKYSSTCVYVCVRESWRIIDEWADWMKTRLSFAINNESRWDSLLQRKEIRAWPRISHCFLRIPKSDETTHHHVYLFLLCVHFKPLNIREEHERERIRLKAWN